MLSAVRRSWKAVSLVVAALGGAVACSSGEQAGTTSPSEQIAACEAGMTIDRFKELVVVEDSVTNDPRSLNGRNGPWSFRYALESMMPVGADPTAFVNEWLDTWANTTRVNGFQTDIESRASGMQDTLVCPWLRSSPSNNCDVSCTTCTARVFDMAKAPFRLVGFANRVDLRLRSDSVSPAGESRLVYAFTNGPADDPASQPMPGTIIFEYGLPVDVLTPKQWAEAWHHLGTHKSFDEPFKVELEQLTERFVKRGMWPSRPNGAAIAQIRTNESVFNWIWQLRQFELTPDGALRLATVQGTPGVTLNNSATLRDFVMQNKDKLRDDLAVMPKFMQAGSADQFLYRWNVPGVDPALRADFARTTCNGCHSGENIPVDVAFHVSPYRSNAAKLSPFLNNPAAPDKDELAKRARLLAAELCQ